MAPLVEASTSLYRLDIPAQPLDQALTALASQTGAQILFATEITQQRHAPALRGNLSVEDALQRLLAGSGLRMLREANGSFLLTAASNAGPAMELPLSVEPLSIFAGSDSESRDQRGHDEVYRQRYSSVYAGREEIERYQGSAPADLFRGMPNVFSGDPRNSGAVDPNIRGVQGPGRVVLSVDGTEQALTAWRGENGVSNRNYIDPGLIGSAQVIKGPGYVRDVRTGIGGAVVLKTLEAADVLAADESWGGELKVEGGNNTVRESIAPSLEGRDYRDVVEEQGLGGWDFQKHRDPLLYRPLRTSNTPFRFGDQSARLALATRQERFELLAAYAWRERGNYFSGKHGADFYRSDGSPGAYDFVPHMARLYKPGDEVPNTSNRTESWLLKGTLRIDEAQSLNIGYRDSRHVYGEIMPSRVDWDESLSSGSSIVPQWPLSTLDLRAWNLDYRYQPEDNRWLDLYLGLWMTDTDSDLYNAGGYPHYVANEDGAFVPGGGRTPVPPGQDNPYLIKDTAHMRAKNTRQGVRLSNRIGLNDQLDLTLAGNFQYEKLRTTDPYPELSGDGQRMLPQSGRRQEHEYSFNFDWRPTNWMTLSAGARSLSYWLSDDLLKERAASGPVHANKYIARVLSHKIHTDALTQEQKNSYLQGYQESRYYYYIGQGYAEDTSRNSAEMDAMWQEVTLALGSSQDLDMSSVWLADADGNFHIADNPYMNGSIELASQAGLVSPVVSSDLVARPVERQGGTRRDRGSWVPFVSASFDTSDNGRLSLSYSEAQRMPSMSEGTLGFSASPYATPLKPEHAYAYELAYSHDLSEWAGARYADVRLAYFHTITRDVIERDASLRYTNIDRQTLAGWELQARYDSGRWFGDLGLVYNQKNRVCDEYSAALLMGPDVYLNPGSFSKCVDNGFAYGYLATMAPPKYSANLNVGTRLFDERLELGSRLTWHYRHRYTGGYLDEDTGKFANSPLAWDTLWLLDAYADFRVSDNLSLNLVGGNLSNRYYIDPLSRTASPAPGRNFRLGLTLSF